MSNPRHPGKTLQEQIEGDHAYRDEPPKHAPREPMTTYTIVMPTTYVKTTDPSIAERESRNGRIVYAVTERRTQQ